MMDECDLNDWMELQWTILMGWKFVDKLFSNVDGWISMDKMSKLSESDPNYTSKLKFTFKNSNNTRNLIMSTLIHKMIS
jgi:hypothetical protein